MDINALIKATTIEEMQAALQDIEVVEEPKKRADPRFVDRRFNVIVKKNGEIIHNYEDVPMNTATRWRKEYRNEGYAVDLIETNTVISATKKAVVFTEKNYVPALEGRIPATVEMSEQRAKQKQIENHSNMVKKMARNNKVKESVDEKIKIYENATGKLIFTGTDEEAVTWFKAHPDFRPSKHTVYLPAKVVENLRRKGF